MVAMIMIVLKTLGRMWENMMRNSLQPATPYVIENEAEAAAFLNDKQRSVDAGSMWQPE